jgi:polysaccharide biosynthesis transport protein
VIHPASEEYDRDFGVEGPPMTDNEHSYRPVTLADYLGILRRRKWAIVQAVVLVPIVAFVITARQDPVYESSADVLLTRQNIGAQLTGLQDPTVSGDPARFAQTQASLARVPEVAERAVREAGVPNRSAGSLLGSSSVSARSDADLLSFTVRDADPEIAGRLATAYAQAFTEYRRELDTATIERARAQLQTRLDQLRAEGQSTSALYQSIAGQEQQLRTLELVSPTNTLVRHASPGGKIAPQPKRNALVGALLGVVLGLSIAFVWEALDRRVRSEREIEQSLRLPILGRLGPPSRRLRRRHELAVVDDPRGAEAEAFRRLRASVDLANLDLGARLVMVTSAVKREGKSTTAANLALTIAQAGHRVVLVDLDLRRPMVGPLLNLDPRAGVIEVVRGQVDLDQALTQVVREGHLDRLAVSGNGAGMVRARPLEVLTAGLSLPSDPSRVAASDALGRLLRQLRERADVVLIDTPPLLVVAETIALAANVDALVVVSRLGVVPRPALRELSRVLQGMPTAKLGLIVTGSSSEAIYGYDGYGYFEPSETGPHFTHAVDRQERS